MNLLTALSKKCIASGKLGWQIFGALVEWRPKAFLAFLLIVTPLTAGISLVLAPGSWIPGLCLLGLNLVVWLIIKACRTLSGLFSLTKQEAGITWCQITILAALGLWIIGFILIFNIQKDGRTAAVFGVIGSVAGWIFQDKLKGVVAFIHLRMHNLLNIDDWIQVPKFNVDGEVKAVTLTTVTILNWDTTTSTIPISALHADHFINLQKMCSGKTYGRRMMKTFTLDTECFRPATAQDIEAYRADGAISPYIPAEDLKEGVLNAHLFRIYLHHWLMANPHVSQKPHLIVRWLEQKDSGMPLQVYTFVLDTDFCSYDFRQSQMTEQILEAMGRFGLRLYQAPSADDIRNINTAAK